MLIQCSGVKDAVDQLIDFCKAGPEQAQVTGLRARMIEDQSFGDFEIER